MSRSRWLAFGLLLGASNFGCGETEHPAVFELAGGGTGGAKANGAGGTDLALGDGGMDAALCGSQAIKAVSDPPNLYFVVDRSSSMLDLLPGSPYSKYENARVAISVMLRAVGHRVRYGAAVFPIPVNDDGCVPGLEVFPTQAGDPPSYAEQGKNGPILSLLLTKLGSFVPVGGTPTAATLSALQPTISGLTGKKTYVVLMTDGAPNCNSQLRCGVNACIPNIEQYTLGNVSCDATLNCCDPKQVGDIGTGQCVDADATEKAVAAYEAAGIDTYVVGMPGSEAYSDVLGRLATAGNTARPGDTPYYAVSDTSELTDALRSIGAQVAITCDLPLEAAPDDPKLVNVYFDDQVVPSNAKNGWHFTGEESIQFTGDACTQLSSGDVLSVQVREGCPTLVR